APQGAIVEVAPARAALMATIAERLAGLGGAGLFLDYGYLRPAIGDTLQALRKHDHEDVLANPGEADLTAHVDFAALAAIVRAHGLDAHLSTQGEFLVEMGLLERAGQLGANADEAAREKIAGEVERLAGPQAMGDLFKVLAVLPAGIAVPP
ncbi:MAG: class I SAM-dependent methyltransferase, partial [Mesorhizobium sp.]